MSTNMYIPSFSDFDPNEYIPSLEKAGEVYIEIPYEHPTSHPEIFKEEMSADVVIEPWNKGWSNNGFGFVENGATEAARIRNTGRKQSESHKKNKAAAKSRQVEIEGITYPSQKAAAKALGYHTSTISTWVKRHGSRKGISIPTGANQWIGVRDHERNNNN